MDYFEEFTNLGTSSTKKAVRDLYKVFFEECKTDIEKLVNLAFAVNKMTWDLYQVNPDLCDVYIDLYYKIVYIDLYYKIQKFAYTSKNFTKEDRDYYFRMTD